MSSWSKSYTSTPPWDTGHPQSAIVELFVTGMLQPGRILDLGSGPGENAIYLAENGFDVVGIDITPEAVEIAKGRAADAGVEVEFLIGDVLELDTYFQPGEFDIVIDSGLFHTLSNDDREQYTWQVKRVLREGGRYFMLCFSVKEKSMGGPRKLSRSEIVSSFSDYLQITSICDTRFDSLRHSSGAKAYLVSAKKQEDVLQKPFSVVQGN